MFRRLALFRSRPDAARLFRGGRIADAGRLPRYTLIFCLAAGGLWAPIVTYLRVTPASYTSDVSLILPGSGAQASVNLANLGQASSSAASAFSSSRISPTQTYKRLLAANRTLERSAALLGVGREALGAPRIKLVDETSLIHFEMSGPSPETAQARAAAVLEAFLEELEILRRDELENRDAAARVAIAGYETDVNRLRNALAALQSESGLLSFDHYSEMVGERDDLALRLATARGELGAAEATACPGASAGGWRSVIPRAWRSPASTSRQSRRGPRSSPISSRWKPRARRSSRPSRRSRPTSLPPTRA